MYLLISEGNWSSCHQSYKSCTFFNYMYDICILCIFGGLYFLLSVFFVNVVVCFKRFDIYMMIYNIYKTENFGNNYKTWYDVLRLQYEMVGWQVLGAGQQ